TLRREHEIERLRVERAEHVGRTAEAAELLAQELEGERELLGERERQGGDDLHLVAIVAGDERERKTRSGAHSERERHGAGDEVARIGALHAAVQRRVVGAPDEVPGGERGELEVAAREGEGEELPGALDGA